MIIKIELDTIDPVTDEDRAILTELAKLQGGDGWNNFTSKRVTLGVQENSAGISEEEVAAAVEKAAAEAEKKAEAAKKAEAEKQKAEAAEKQKAEAEKKAAAAEKRKAAAEKKAAEEAQKKAAEEAEEPAEESAEEPEDEGTPAALESDGPTLDDAVKLASTLISGGNSAAVKSVLKEIGVRKVGELSQDQIATFIDQLDAL